MIINSYSKEQVNLLKGIGILLIVIHNYYHLIPPAFGESEFRYNPGLVPLYLEYLSENWSSISNLAFSYFGHYGVQVFVFFSVFGLTKKYWLNPEFGYLRFLGGRLSKIYITFVISIIMYVALGWVKSILISTDYVQWWDSILYKLLLVSNFIPNQALKPVGPWWFLPFIFTLYIVFPFLLRGYKRYGKPFLWIAAFIGIAFESLFGGIIEEGGVSVNHLVVGYLPIIALAMYMASKDSVRFHNWQMVMVLALFVIGNLNGVAWILSGITFLLLTLFVFELTLDKLSGENPLVRFIAYCGKISFHLFLVNGFLRYPFQTIAEKYDSWYVSDMLAVISLVFSIFGALLLRFMDLSVRRYFSLRRATERH